MEIRKLETRRARHRIFYSHLILAVLLTFAAGQVSAGKPSSKASLDSSTTCALDVDTNPTLVVTTTLENKHSKNIAEVRGGMISATYRQRGDEPGTGSMIFTLADKAILDILLILPAVVDPILPITAEFPLCDSNGVLAEVAGAQELNGASMVLYGIWDGDEEPRTVESRCRDDPDTLENEGGIKVADVIDAIRAACQ